MPIDTGWFQVDLWLVIVIAIILVLFLVFAVIWSVRAHRGRVSAGREDMIGRTAVVDIALEPKGVVLVEGERWTAISDSGQIAPGEEVVITAVEGLKLRVSNKRLAKEGS